MRSTKAEHTRHKILSAAKEFVLREGAHKLTLDAVVQQAGVSKGSLLYHFPTKEVLIEAMLRAMLEELAEDIISRTPNSADPESLLEAYVDALFAAAEPAHRERSVALLAAAANAPELLELVRDWLQEWEQKLSTSGQLPGASRLAIYAAYGAWLASTLGLGARPSTLPGAAKALAALSRRS